MAQCAYDSDRAGSITSEDDNDASSIESTSSDISTNTSLAALAHLVQTLYRDKAETKQELDDAKQQATRAMRRVDRMKRKVRDRDASLIMSRAALENAKQRDDTRDEERGAVIAELTNAFCSKLDARDRRVHTARQQIAEHESRADSAEEAMTAYTDAYRVVFTGLSRALHAAERAYRATRRDLDDVLGILDSDSAEGSVRLEAVRVKIGEIRTRQNGLARVSRRAANDSAHAKHDVCPAEHAVMWRRLGISLGKYVDTCVPPDDNGAPN